MAEKIRQVLHVEHICSTGYTSNETGVIAFQCQAEKNKSIFHLHENMQHVSILAFDSNLEEAIDCPGRIITTNLNRTLMPLIGYSIGNREYRLCMS